MFMRYEAFLVASERLQMHAPFPGRLQISDSAALDRPHSPLPSPGPSRATRCPHAQQPNFSPAQEYGPTKLVGLGRVVHARSGNNGSKTNVGLWVRHTDEHAWLCALLTHVYS